MTVAAVRWADAPDPTDDHAKEWREEKAGRAPGGGVEEDATGVKLEEAREAHIEAAGQWSGDRGEAGDELRGKEEGAAGRGGRIDLAELVDAGLRVEA